MLLVKFYKNLFFIKNLNIFLIILKNIHKIRLNEKK